jgi:signal transduction histidine kinase
MRRFLPKALPGWILFILIFGLLAWQVATFTIVSLDRAANDDIRELYRLNERALSVVKLLSTTQQKTKRNEIALALSNSNYALTITDTPVVASAISTDDALAEVEDVLIGGLARYGVVDARVRRDAAGFPRPDGAETAADPDAGDVELELLALAERFAESPKLTASIQFADGTWLNLTTAITPTDSILNRNSAPLYLLVAVLIVAITVWSIHRLTAPYRLMERAVVRIGSDLKSPQIEESGSREFRAAAKAINTMQAKLREYVEDREHLAAALAHDLRTPLTRMRLRLEKMQRSPLRSSLVQDLGEIESIARSVVDLTTLEVTDEATERVDFVSLVYSIADGNPAVSFAGEPPRPRSLICQARPVALKRCVGNLIDNAIAYGRKAHLTIESSPSDIRLIIIDEGPGIPEEQLGEVLRPFVRLERSRNRRTGGMGLGLTIASTIARGMGGEINLTNEPSGGLRTQLRLPRAA